MSSETRPIPFEEFTSDIASVFERVVRDRETVVVENGNGEAVVLKPASTRSRRVTKKKRTEADRQAFLSSLGGWKDLVDTDALIRDIYESRSISTRPHIEL